MTNEYVTRCDKVGPTRVICTNYSLCRFAVGLMFPSPAGGNPTSEFTLDTTDDVPYQREAARGTTFSLGPPLDLCPGEPPYFIRAIRGEV